MKWLIIILFIGCASPTAPDLEESSFSISNVGTFIHDVPGGKGILLQTWVVRLDDGDNYPEVTFYIYQVNDGDITLLEEVIATIQVAPYAMAKNLVSESTVNVYTSEQLRTITIGMGIR